ncbi:MAG: CBS domain-containing protein [Acidimicrobiales bacterium]
MTSGPEASLLDAMQRMSDEEVTHLPVLDDGLLVGICTRADLVRARSDELALERLELGWLAPVLQRRDRVGPRWLVVGNRSLGGEALMAELARRVEVNRQIRFHVVVPLAVGGDLTAARERLETQLGLIGELGVPATGEIGDADPLAAIDAALRREHAMGVILSTLPPGASRWLRSSVPGGVSRRVDVPVVVVHDQA